ncbi:hypothetical protein TL16_g01857 [Triparma laevis f. inornata]|uniref:Sulphur transport domain-containing protein n=1 Tax=Triparma laevis f. inornata TaxID=1714386 RepID=A0A9W6ZQD3_9STRA|nr:hypothetical protein TL16_g01857 [Triparma laevis f. inornata]
MPVQSDLKVHPKMELEAGQAGKVAVDNEAPNKQDDHIPVAPPSKLNLAASYLISILCGTLWGFVFEKSRVFEVRSIRGQMVFERWVMLKMFMGAMGLSAFALSYTAAMKPKEFEKLREKFKDECDRSVLRATTLGAFLLGVGMSLASACPGMVLAQIGAGQKNSLFTVAGGIFGGFVYGALEPTIKSTLIRPPNSYVFPREKRFVDEYLNVSPSKTPLLIFFLGIFALCFSGVLEIVSPFDSIPEETDVANDCSNVFECRGWPPSIPGVILGSLQFLLIPFLGSCMGSATAFQSLVALPFLLTTTPTKREELKKSDSTWLSYLVKYTPDRLSTQWQLLYCGFCCVGAYISSTLSETYGTSPGLSPIECFLGGVLMLFGSRLAAGCTSWHGISGFPILLNTSWVAVPAMFGGGIVSAFILQAVQGDGFYPAYDDELM